MKPILSIIIVNFNTQNFLNECLESLFAHYRSNIKNTEYELIVVDNASKENIGGFLRKQYPEVAFIQRKENGGFATANNEGIAKSSGKYVLLLNPDTIVNEKVLSRMIEIFESDDQVGVTTCKVLLKSGALDDACHRGFPTPWRALCQFSGLSAIFSNSLFFNGYHLGYQHMDRVHEIDSCVGAFMMIRRQVGEEVEWLDEDYFWYGEDLDFCYRVKEKGYKILFIPDVSILHYKGVASGIKKHSQYFSTASRETKEKATKARFEVMKLFYEKHYQHKYPSFMKWFVLTGIELKYQITKLFL